MPQPLKFKTDVDTGPFKAGMDNIVKLGANAAAQIDKTLGGKFAGIAAKLSSPQAAAMAALSQTLSVGERVVKNTVAGVGRTFEAGRAIQQLVRETGGGAAGLVILEDKFRKAGLESGKVATSIFRLQKSIAGIEDDENKGGAGALQKLGLNMANLRKLAPDQQLFAVGRALATIEDPAARTAASMQIFGKTGAELGAVFNGSDFNRISPQLQAKADLLARNSEAFERAGRSIQRVSGLVQASANTFYGGVAAGVVSGLQPLLDDMKGVDLTAQGQGFGKALGDGAVAVHKMLEELKASGIVELGRKVAAGVAAGVTVAGDAVKAGTIATKPTGQTSAMLGAASFIGGGLVDAGMARIRVAHNILHAPENLRAKLKADSDARYADLHNNPSDPGVAKTNNRPELVRSTLARFP